MNRKRANGDQLNEFKVRQDAIKRSASADSMMNATIRSNGSQRASAHNYGNLGDSIEMRYNDGGSLLNGYGRMHSEAHSGAGGGFTYLKKFSSNSKFNHDIIASCQLAYLGYGVVKSIIDLYADFATEGIQIDHPDESVRTFYKTWATKVDLKDRIHSMFLNMFISANVFIHRHWANLTPQEKRAMKSAKGAEVVNDSLLIRGKSSDKTIDGRETNVLDWFLGQKEIHLSDDSKNKAKADNPSLTEQSLPDNPEKRIPWGYTFLNPLQMEPRGRRLRGDNYWVMAIDKHDTLDLARGMGMTSFNELGTTHMNLPKEFMERVKKYQGVGAGYSAEIKLDKEELSVVQAPGKFDWFNWAVPFCFPALRALSFKDCLRNMELNACRSVINSIFLFKLGNIKEGLPAEDEHFERLADMLQQPGQALNIIWNEAIDAEVVQADIKGIFDTDKHESADKDILTALGVPEVLIGGKGGAFSNSYVAVATVLERLESYRNKVHSWLMGELKVIADAMGFKKMPTIKFGRTSLKDEKAQQAFLTGLYDRGILSADELLQEANTSAEVQASKMKEEKKKYKEKDIFEPRGPFVKDPKPPVGPAAKKPKTPNGRPKNSQTGPTGKQSNPRGPQGQNIAHLLDTQEKLRAQGYETIDLIDTYITNRVLSAKGVKNVKGLKAEDKHNLEWLIYHVFSHMDTTVDCNDEVITDLLSTDACRSVRPGVLEIYSSNAIAEDGRSPNKQERRDLMVSAWVKQSILEYVSESSDEF